MRYFIENNIREIINVLIFVVCILPAIIVLLLIILGFNFSLNQIMAMASLFGIGVFALAMSSVFQDF